MHIRLKDILVESIEDRVYNNPNFKKWFANSAVVDNNGNPLKVYHGTGASKNFDIFNTALRGSWFAADPKEASNYTKYYTRIRYGYGYGYDEREYTKKSGRVLPVYLSINNPKKYTDEDLEKMIDTWVSVKGSYKSGFKKLVSDLKSQGYDGIIFGSRQGHERNIYIAFKSTQIKSVFNNGEFDPNNPDIGK